MERRTFISGVAASLFATTVSSRSPDATIAIGTTKNIRLPADSSDNTWHKYRPVKGAMNECNINLSMSFATNGPYIFEVTDTDSAMWSSDVSVGDRFRASNNHVYARANRADLNEHIVQPSPAYGGDGDDIVGKLKGYVPIEENQTVDVAFRSADPRVDRVSYKTLDIIPDGAVRNNYESIESVVKYGKRTQKTYGTNPKITDIDISYNTGRRRLKKVLEVVSPDGDSIIGPGDSGSPVFTTDGRLVGIAFASAWNGTKMYISTVREIERQAGVKFIGADTLRTELDAYDINNDGEHTFADVTQHYQNMRTDGDTVDVNRDGNITPADTTRLYNNTPIYERRRDLLFNQNT